MKIPDLLVTTFIQFPPIKSSIISILITASVVSFFSIAFHGRITYDYIITGTITSALISYLFSSINAAYQKKLQYEIEQKSIAEAENLRLIEILSQSLAFEKSKPVVTSDIKEEKLKTINQLMHKVNHHVGNLSNQLQIIEVQILSKGSVSEHTINTLKKSIFHTSKEMILLSNINDPFDERPFKINFS